jgi:hypothetical protein
LGKKLGLQRMVEQRQWAREELELRITAGGPMVINWERTIQYHSNKVEEAVRNRWIKQLRLYMKEQVIAEVLLKVGLDSLVDLGEQTECEWIIAGHNQSLGLSQRVLLYDSTASRWHDRSSQMHYDKTNQINCRSESTPGFAAYKSSGLSRAKK